MHNNGRNGLGPGEPIFHGAPSESLWARVNCARTKKDLRNALYFSLCNCQVLEDRVVSIEDALREAVKKAVGDV